MRIVAVDRPGAGHSSYNPRGHFHTIAADLVELLDHLGLERVVVMASSGELAGFEGMELPAGAGRLLCRFTTPALADLRAALG